MFRFHLDRTASETLVQQAREQIVSALHLGQLRVGDRLPSVRSLSRTWGIDPKTALRIYHVLARGGYVRLRPGSGAYVKEVASSLLDQARALGLLRLVRRHVTIAEQFEIDPARYADIIDRYTRSRLAPEQREDKLAVIECNREQVSIFSGELRRRLRVGTVPILVSPLVRGDRRAISAAGACRYLVTTDFHFAELERVARALSKRLLCVRLDPRFIQNLLAFATRGMLGMIVTDPAFMPAFRRSIIALGLDPQATKRIEAVAASDRTRVRALISRADSLYVSPLCSAQVKSLIPATMPVLEPLAHLSSESVESIEALLIFGDGSVRRPPRASPALRRPAGAHPGPDP